MLGVFERFWGDSYDARVCEPTDFLRNLGALNSMYLGSQQHDTQEFLRMTLDGIHEELKKKVPRSPARYYADEYDRGSGTSGGGSSSSPPGSTGGEAVRRSAEHYELNYAKEVVNSPTKRKVD